MEAARARGLDCGGARGGGGLHILELRARHLEDARAFNARSSHGVPVAVSERRFAEWIVEPKAQLVRAYDASAAEDDAADAAAAAEAAAAGRAAEAAAAEAAAAAAAAPPAAGAPPPRPPTRSRARSCSATRPPTRASARRK